MFGSRIILTDTDMNVDKAELLACKYSFNDMWKDPKANKVILASAQSGGSCIHILNLDENGWKKDFMALNPPGKIQAILDNTATIRKNLKTFKKPSYQNKSQPVFFMSESRKNKDAKAVIENIEANYNNPTFLIKPKGGAKENWDRSSIANEKYRTRRDKRMKYTATQDELVNKIASHYDLGPGIAYWAGHGNDPYMYQRSTTEKILERSSGKKTVLIYPELEDHTKDFAYVMEDLIYPLAKHARANNASIYVRTKHTFWQSSIYLDNWKRLVSGEFSDVFVPAMEETTDKSMELSLAARLGMWSSGATDSWGARCARDNTSFDRSRQHSHQMLPNHFLRTMVYSISSGAQYLDNFAVDQKYMSLLWDLIAKGALYAPKRSDILSFSPVHLSIVNPDERYIDEGNNVKPVVFFNETEEKENPMVFSRLNGTWPGAKLTDWDFSRYAAGAKERRLNFIPTYENGLVLITPPQRGEFADNNTKRSPLTKNLHPLYKNITQEYITDGRHYFSEDGKTYTADTYYTTLSDAIETSKFKLPITVKGNVGWVVAQVGSKTLRLTLVDSGYINPEDRVAEITFNTITPLSINDILNGDTFSYEEGTVKINVPLGGFRFIDVELSKSFTK